jgi:hypothetical protein
LVSSPESLKMKRSQIWQNVLEVSQISNKVYEDFKRKVEANLDMIATVEEVINLDVSRSEHQMPGVDPLVLISVLRAYALYNPEMEYCQGLNYVAGLLLMVFKDPELAFRALTVIVERFKLADLFN